VTIANHATNEEIMAKLTAGGDSGFDGVLAADIHRDADGIRSLE
jgi:hypothetical protein